MTRRGPAARSSAPARASRYDGRPVAADGARELHAGRRRRSLVPRLDGRPGGAAAGASVGRSHRHRRRARRALRTGAAARDAAPARGATRRCARARAARRIRSGGRRRGPAREGRRSDRRAGGAESAARTRAEAPRRARRRAAPSCSRSASRSSASPTSSRATRRSAAPSSGRTPTASFLADAKGKRPGVPLAPHSIPTAAPGSGCRRTTELKPVDGSATSRAYAALLAGRKSWAKGLEATGDADAAALRSDADRLRRAARDGRRRGDARAGSARQRRGPPPPAHRSRRRCSRRSRGLLRTTAASRSSSTARAAAQARRRGARDRFDARRIAGAAARGRGGRAARRDRRGPPAYEFKSAEQVLEDFAGGDAATVVVDLRRSSCRRGSGDGPSTRSRSSVVLAKVACATASYSRRRSHVDYEVKYAAPIEGMSTFSTLRVAVAADDGDGTMANNLDLTTSTPTSTGRRILDLSDPGSEAKPVATRIAYAVGLEYDGSRGEPEVTDSPTRDRRARRSRTGSSPLYWKSDAAFRPSRSRDRRGASHPSWTRPALARGGGRAQSHRALRRPTGRLPHRMARKRLPQVPEGGDA